MPTLLWRRKTSTPFLPGAWPNSSVSDQGDDQRLPVYSDDAPPQLPELRHLSPREGGEQGEQDPAALAEEGWGLPIVTEKHAFEDNGLAVGARVRDLRPVTVSSPASTSAPLSASLSQASTFSDPTDSEGVLTPQSVQGPLWLSTHSETSFPQTTKDTILSGSGSSYHSFDDHQTRHDHDSFSHDATIDTINVNATTSSSNTADFFPHRSATRAAYRTPPILDFSEPLPQSRISLDWDRLTSSPNNAPPQSPDSPQSPIEFSVPSTVGSPVLDEGEPAVFNSAAMATTFFPVPTSSSHHDGESSETHEDTRQAASPPLSLPSAYSFGTDSPVLPAEVGPDQDSQSLTHSPYALMAADLDAFAAAATGSSLSLPTSLHSAASDALLAEAEMDHSPALPLAHLRAYSGDSAGQTPSPVVAACGSNALEFPSTPKAARDQGEYDENGDAAVEEAIRTRSRRMSAPLLHSPRTPVHKSVQRERSRTTSSRVEAQQAEDPSGAGGSTRPTKLPVLGKMRKLKGKLLSLFNGKGAKAAGTGVVVDSPAELAVKKTRTTAVTKVEFESEHPIPAPETPTRDARASRRSLPLRMSKPSSHSSQSLRCDSFLPIEDSESSSKGILSIPLQHMRGSPSVQFKKDRGVSGSDPASLTRVARGRTLTAPTKPQLWKGISSDDAPTAKQARRFSLSSAFSRSRLDVLKTTVAPHPPLPDFPQSATCDQHPPHREEPVRPVSMITPTGLDSKSSQASLKGTISGSKKGKERARPVSMVVSSGAQRRVFLDHPQITVQAPSPVIAAASTFKEDKRAKHSSMLVGKEKDARRDMVEVAGSRFRMHHPMKSANEHQGTHKDVSAAGDIVQVPDVVPEQITEEASAEETVPTTEASHKTAVRERVPIERPGPEEVVQADPAPITDTQAHTRRFSLSSAISQRAIRARSIIVSVGRRSSESEQAADSSGSTDATATPAPSPGASSARTTRRRDRGSTFSSIFDAGVRFDILTPGFGFVLPSPTSSPPRASPPASRRLSTDMDFRRARSDAPVLGPLSLEATRDVVEMEEHPPADSDLDSMSFAGTTTLLEGMESSISMNSSYADSFVDAREELTESSVGLDTPQETPVHECAPALGEPFMGGEPVAKRIELARALSSAVGSCGSSSGGAPTAETVEREEERGFLRALGLEVPVEQTSKTAGTSEVR